MKTRLYIIILASGLLGACSGSMMLSTGYDDIYYTPGDEPVQTVVKKSAASLDNAYRAMDFSDAGTTEKGLNVYQTDTLQADAYYEAGDSSMIVNNYYENEGYDYYSGIPYSSRIRRFYRYSPSFSYFSPYYSSFYDPFRDDPFYFGFNSGYNMFRSRYYSGSSYYGYSPYYNDWYYPGSSYYGSYGSGFWSPYSYYSYWGSPYYYNSGVYYRSTGRSDDIYVGHRRSNMTNRNVISTSNRSKSNYANYRDANRRTNTNSSGMTPGQVTTSRNTRTVNNTSTINRRTGTASNRVTTTRVPQKNSTVNTNRRSSTYIPRYSRPKVTSKPTYNRSTRTYQGRSSGSSSGSSKSVYSRPRSTGKSTYSRPVNRSSGSGGTSYSGSGRSSSSSYSRGSSSTGSRSSGSSGRSSGGSGRRR